MESSLLQGIKDWSPVGTLIASLAGVGTLLFGVWKTLKEFRQSHQDRIAALEEHRKELLWKQINTAKELLNDIHTHDLAKNAVRMLDWSKGNPAYKDCPGEEKNISYQQVLTALQMNDVPPDKPADVYIRDCFDWFFYRVDRIEHYIQRGLIDFRDVEAVFPTYAKAIAADGKVFESFLDFHEYELAKRFFRRYGLTGSNSSFSLTSDARREESAEGAAASG